MSKRDVVIRFQNLISFSWAMESNGTSISQGTNAVLLIS